jgi:hypothetical protein
VSKEKAKTAKALLDNMIDKEVPALLDAIMATPDIPADMKAARVGLASTALHHLKLLRGAIE